MKGPIAWFVQNPVAANILMVLIVAGGIMAGSGMKLELWPELSFDIVTITVPYPGGAPEEVEEAICVKIEEKIRDLEGIKRVTSNATENAGTIAVEVLPSYDVRELLDDIKARVDAIDTFPAESEKPIIEEIGMRNHVISIAVWGDASERALKEWGETLREELLDLEGITQVELAGVRPYEVAIEVSEYALRKHGLSFDDVAGAVRRSSLDLPGGSVKAAGGEILLRAEGQAYTGDAFREIVLMTREDGARLTVGDVANVVDGFADTDTTTRFNGKPAAVLKIFKIGDQDVLEIAGAVREYVVDARDRTPDGIQLSLWQDNSSMLANRLGLLIRNGRAGFLLVFIVLALFLRLRLAFWVTLGIPLAFLGTFALMPGLDVTLNMISLFSFILVLGIVVDDAIVVGESIHTEEARGGDRLRAAIRGTRKVVVPVIFAVLTTVAAFLPMMFLPGVMGKFIRVIPLIVIPTLLFSLVESMLILPAHLGHGSAKEQPAKTPRLLSRLSQLSQLGGRGLEEFARRVYRPVSAVAFRWRYATIAFFFCLLLLTLGLVAGGRLDFTFFPKTDTNVVVARVTMPEGVSARDTARAVDRLERAALRLRDELATDGSQKGSGDAIRHIVASVGDQPVTRDLSSGKISGIGSHRGEVAIGLSPSEERAIGSAAIGRRWRELVGEIPGTEELVFLDRVMSVGKPVDIQLAGRDLEAMQSAADALKEALRTYPEVYGIADSFRAGKKEIELSIEPDAEATGLAFADLARQVRQGFYGEEAQRVQRGRHEVRVMVRYTADERRTLAGLENMRVRTPAGLEVPFSAVARAEYGRGYSTIQRTDGKRTVHVTADVDEARGNANRVLARLTETALPAIMADHRGVTYSLEGEQREQQESMTALYLGFLFSLLMIYALMAIPFKSYVQPFVVMSAIPFGLVGAVWGHYAMGIDLSVMSVLGMVALAGVTVNDSLVLVDYVNRKRREDGVGLLEAVRAAGAARFRPILLTSMTTFAGLLPILTETSLQARFLIPMAVSLAFGVLFSTVITLVLVPSGYLILEDVKGLAFRLSPPPPTPAASR